MYRRILVPLDGTRFGEHALPHAIGIAVRTGATIELCHVHHHREYDPDLAAMTPYQFQHIDQADVDWEEREREKQRAYLEERAADMELRYQVRVRTRLLDGSTAEAICREASDIVADLVVLASHARTGLDRLRNGHLAHELVQQLNVPALCVHPSGDEAPLVAAPPQRVLVTLDGSSFSEQVLDAVIPLIAAIGARATLLHVVSPQRILVGSADDLQRHIPNREEALVYVRGVADSVRDRIPAPEVAAVVDSDAVTAITNVVAHGGYDMVAMATHGRGGLTRLIVGSVAEQVLERASVPVLLYRPRLVPLPPIDLTDAFRIYG